MLQEHAFKWPRARCAKNDAYSVMHKGPDRSSRGMTCRLNPIAEIISWETARLHFRGATIFLVSIQKLRPLWLKPEH